eukprot:TRINITY_DN19575_c0_g1_i1.p1 TRINITY_DN19575_c0_g1~~TRINITY_DN19575_c0_g1_i1.p1  ORF type:complete len:779 (-),score=45.86 TRINITY_DN19575_c0_g1_i1:17-2353(-)
MVRTPHHDQVRTHSSENCSMPTFLSITFHLTLVVSCNLVAASHWSVYHVDGWIEDCVQTHNYIDADDPLATPTQVWYNNSMYCFDKSYKVILSSRWRAVINSQPAQARVGVLTVVQERLVYLTDDSVGCVSLETGQVLWNHKRLCREFHKRFYFSNSFIYRDVEPQHVHKQSAAGLTVAVDVETGNKTLLPIDFDSIKCMHPSGLLFTVQQLFRHEYPVPEQLSELTLWTVNMTTNKLMNKLWSFNSTRFTKAVRCSIFDDRHMLVVHWDGMWGIDPNGGEVWGIPDAPDVLWCKQCIRKKLGVFYTISDEALLSHWNIHTGSQTQLFLGLPKTTIRSRTVWHNPDYLGWLSWPEASEEELGGVRLVGFPIDTTENQVTGAWLPAGDRALLWFATFNDPIGGRPLWVQQDNDPEPPQPVAISVVKNSAGILVCVHDELNFPLPAVWFTLQRLAEQHSGEWDWKDLVPLNTGTHFCGSVKLPVGNNLLRLLEHQWYNGSVATNSFNISIPEHVVPPALQCPKTWYFSATRHAIVRARRLHPHQHHAPSTQTTQNQHANPNKNNTTGVLIPLKLPPEPCSTKIVENATEAQQLNGEIDALLTFKVHHMHCALTREAQWLTVIVAFEIPPTIEVWAQILTTVDYDGDGVIDYQQRGVVFEGSLELLSNAPGHLGVHRYKGSRLDAAKYSLDATIPLDYNFTAGGVEIKVWLTHWCNITTPSAPAAESRDTKAPVVYFRQDLSFIEAPFHPPLHPPTWEDGIGHPMAPDKLHLELPFAPFFN